MDKDQDIISRYLELFAGVPLLFSNEGAPLRIITDKDEIGRWKQQHPSENIGVVYEDGYVCIMRDLVEFFGGEVRGYTRLINRADIEGGKSVAVLPVMGGKILLLRQYRYATRSWHIEIPHGFGEVGISPEDNARKEIAEETGLEIAELISLGTYHCNTGMEAEETRLFFARLASVGAPNKDEGIERFEWAIVSEMEGLIKSNIVTDGFTIAAFARARLYGLI
jgi:ADP-ribose pyrophosphatase